MEQNLTYSQIDEIAEDGFELVETKTIFDNISDCLDYFVVIVNYLKYPWATLWHFIEGLLKTWNNTATIVETDNVLPLTYEESRLDQLKRITEDMQREAEKENEQKDYEFARKLAERRERTRQYMLHMDGDYRVDQNMVHMKKLESQRNIEEMLAKSRLDQFFKDQTAALETEIFTQQGHLGTEKIEKCRLQSKALHQENILAMDQKFQKNAENYEIEEEIRRNELLEQQENAEKRRIIIQEQLECDMEDLLENEKLQRQEMDEQALRSQKIFNMHVLNEVMEGNWTDRLNKLRNSFQEMSKFDKHGKSEIMLAKIKSQKSLMQAEKLEMRKFYEETGKTFLLDIEEAIGDVLEECDRVVYLLENEPSNKVRVKECLSALSKATLEIPTLAELKQRYRNDDDF